MLTVIDPRRSCRQTGRHAILFTSPLPQDGGQQASGYQATATFNKRSGRFEGAGAVNKMDVGDSRRQVRSEFPAKRDFFCYRPAWSQTKIPCGGCCSTRISAHQALWSEFPVPPELIGGRGRRQQDGSGRLVRSHRKRLTVQNFLAMKFTARML